MGQVFHTLEPEFKGEVVFVNIDVSDPAENKLSSQYQIQYIPTTYFLNHKGEITFSYVGVIQQDEMRAKLRALAEAE
jgi:thioredoxin-like negative regulator of GroEL